MMGRTGNFPDAAILQQCAEVNSQADRYYGQERPEVRSAVPASARKVVDVGCANGRLGARLKAERPGIEVRGIEAVAEAAERARRVLDDAIHGKAEDDLPEHWPAPDCVIFADVLEHLIDPWAVVSSWRTRLAARVLAGDSPDFPLSSVGALRL